MTIESIKPQRTCAGCRKRHDQDDLLAVTRLKNGKVVVNPGHVKSGRSVYLCKKAVCLLKVQGKKGRNGLQSGLRVQIPEKIWEDLQKLI